MPACNPIKPQVSDCGINSRRELFHFLVRSVFQIQSCILLKPLLRKFFKLHVCGNFSLKTFSSNKTAWRFTSFSICFGVIPSSGFHVICWNPTDDSIRKIVYMSVCEISKRWTMAVRDWGIAYSQFAIFFEDRLAADEVYPLGDIR